MVDLDHPDHRDHQAQGGEGDRRHGAERTQEEGGAMTSEDDGTDDYEPAEPALARRRPLVAYESG